MSNEYDINARLGRLEGKIDSQKESIDRIENSITTMVESCRCYRDDCKEQVDKRIDQVEKDYVRLDTKIKTSTKIITTILVLVATVCSGLYVYVNGLF